MGSRRTIRQAMGGENASAALGELSPGCEIFGFSKGQYSLIHLIEAILAQTGPADLTVATWTAAQREVDLAYRLLSDGRIRTIKFLVDFSFPRRQPGYCAAMRERFGDHAIRVTKTHAKFCMIRNATWDVVVRTSMNLNTNMRFESFDISDDRVMADFLESVVADVFGTQGAGEGFSRRPYENVDEFLAMGSDPNREYGAEAQRYGVNLDDPARPGMEVIR